VSLVKNKQPKLICKAKHTSLFNSLEEIVHSLQTTLLPSCSACCQPSLAGAQHSPSPGQQAPLTTKAGGWWIPAGSASITQPPSPLPRKPRGVFPALTLALEIMKVAPKVIRTKGARSFLRSKSMIIKLL